MRGVQQVNRSASVAMLLMVAFIAWCTYPFAGAEVRKAIFIIFGVVPFCLIAIAGLLWLVRVSSKSQSRIGKTITEKE